MPQVPWVASNEFDKKKWFSKSYFKFIGMHDDKKGTEYKIRPLNQLSSLNQPASTTLVLVV